MKKFFNSVKRGISIAFWRSVDFILLATWWIIIGWLKLLWTLFPKWFKQTVRATAAIIIVMLPLTAAPYAFINNPSAVKYVAGPDGFDFGCLALNSYRERQKAEANKSAEPYTGLLGTAQVFKTRYEIGFHQSGNPVPKNVCDSIWEAEQASWTLWSDSLKYTITTGYAWDWYRSWFAAIDAYLDYGLGGFTPVSWYVKYQVKTADHYFNDEKIVPSWASDMTFCGRVGNHVYYADRHPKACQG